MERQRSVIERGSELWPTGLSEEPCAPERLCVLGDAGALLRPLVQVTGTRRATPYGLACARLAGRAVAESGAALLTGAAMGCEAEAARAALEAGGAVVVWSAAGALAPYYPDSSADVFDAAACVVSARGWSSFVTPHGCVSRRQLMAALARATVVCEAALSSSICAEARHALSLGRAVLAFPGSVFSPESAGANALVREGARMACTERDVAGALADALGKGMPREAQGEVARALATGPMRACELADALGRDLHEVLRELVELEVAGAVAFLPDGRWSASARAHARAHMCEN